MLEGGFAFLRDMAIVVIFSLGFSLIEAFFVLPAHLSSPHVLRSKGRANLASKIRGKITGVISFIRDRGYGKLLRAGLDNRLVAFAIIVALFPITIGLVQGGFIKTTFFPNIAFSQINIELAFKPGTREYRVENYLKEIEKKVWELNDELKEKYNEPVDYLTFTSTNLGSAGGLGESGSHAGSINVFFRELDDTPINSMILTRLLNDKIGRIPEAEKMTVGGRQRWGKPVSLKLVGKNSDELLEATEYLKAQLNNISALKEVVDDNSVGRRELQLELTAQANFLGLSESLVSQQVRQGFFGEEVQRFQKGVDEVKVWVRYPNSGRLNLGQIEDMKVKVADRQYPLADMVSYKLERGISDIRHYQTARTITVEAELVDPFADVPPILEQVNTQIVPQLLANYPGIRVEAGGQGKESAKSGKEIGTLFGAAFAVMFLIILFLFRSFLQALMVMLMIPLGVLGAFWGHGVQGLPVSLLSVWGIVALTGVLINDAVVFLDAYNRNVLNGMKVKEAAYDAGKSRFRPILLTSLTTVFGLYPLILEKSFQAQFLIPMAISMAWGLILGTIVILLFFPVLIVMMNDLQVYAKWLWTGQRPEREEVEKVIIDAKREELLA